MSRLSQARKRREKADREGNAAAVQLAKAIRAAAKDGMTPTQIADEAGVSRQWVHRVLARG